MKYIVGFVGATGLVIMGVIGVITIFTVMILGMLESLVYREFEDFGGLWKSMVDTVRDMVQKLWALIKSFFED